MQEVAIHETEDAKAPELNDADTVGKVPQSLWEHILQTRQAAKLADLKAVISGFRAASKVTRDIANTLVQLVVVQLDDTSATTKKRVLGLRPYQCLDEMAVEGGLYDHQIDRSVDQELFRARDRQLGNFLLAWKQYGTRSVRKLSLCFWEVTAVALALVADAFPNLAVLMLDGCLVEDEDVFQPSEACKRLVELRIRPGPFIRRQAWQLPRTTTAAAAESMAVLQSLRSLHITVMHQPYHTHPPRHIQESHEAVQAWANKRFLTCAQLAELTQLTSLHVTTSGISTMVNSLSISRLSALIHLQELSLLGRCSASGAYPEEEIADVIRCLHRLKRVAIEQLSGLLWAAVACTDVEHLRACHILLSRDCSALAYASSLQSVCITAPGHGNSLCVVGQLLNATASHCSVTILKGDSALPNPHFMEVHNPADASKDNARDLQLIRHAIDSGRLSIDLDMLELYCDTESVIVAAQLNGWPCMPEVKHLELCQGSLSHDLAVRIQAAFPGITALSIDYGTGDVRGFLQVARSWQLSKLWVFKCEGVQARFDMPNDSLGPDWQLSDILNE